MVTKTVAIYTFFDDLLKSISYKEPKSRKTIEKAISFVRGTGLLPNILEKSRFNRRMHAVSEIFSMLFFQVGQIIKGLKHRTNLQHR